VSPADGSSGVRADAPVIITFSEPMDRAMVEDAVVSSAGAEPEFSWDDSGRVLTLFHAAPFEYAAGTDPATLAAKTYTISVSRGATDLAGNRLADAASATFGTLRRLQSALTPTPDQSNRRVQIVTNAGVVAGCLPAIALVGEVSDVRYTKLFVSFDLGQLPEELVEIEQGQLAAGEIVKVTGAPYGLQSLGVLAAERVQFTSLGVTAFEAPALAEPRLLADALFTRGPISAEVTRDVAAAHAAGTSAQFRIGFTNGLSENGELDFVTLSCSGEYALGLTYLAP
jgi:hypothetical protein